MFKGIREDIRTVMQEDPAAKNWLAVMLLYAGLHAIWWYRIAHWFHRHGMLFFAQVFSQFSRLLTNIEIHPGAVIGRRFFIDHGAGIVVGETAIIGDDCLLYQGVTLGGTGNESGKRHPTLGNRVVVGSGAKVLGNLTIGDDTRIGANSVVLTNVPGQSTVVGIPGKIVRHQGLKGDDVLAHANLPDPIAESIAYLNARVNQLEAELKKTGKDVPKTPLPACEDPVLLKMLGQELEGKDKEGEEDEED